MTYDVPVVDAHHDLLLELALRSAEERPFERHYLSTLRAGGVGLQVCPITVLPGQLPEPALRAAMRQANAFRRALRECPDETAAIETREDLDRIAGGGRIGMLLAMEGTDALGRDVDLIDLFWDLGVRMVGLTWTQRNLFADGDAEPPGGGLSTLGRKLVERLARLGAIIDLAHANETTFADVLACAPDAPVVISHGGCRALYDIPRITSDEQLRALAERDGVIGIAVAPPLLSASSDTSIERWVDHVEHVARVVGIEHVGVGTDFVLQIHRAGALTEEHAGMPPGSLEGSVMLSSFDGLAGPEGLPELTTALARRGYDDAAIEAVLGGNFLRVLHRLPTADGRG